MTGRAAGERPAYCAFCAVGNHGSCAGSCACAARRHDPDVETAAQMRLYQNPGLKGAGLSTEALATQYRQKAGLR